MAAGGKEGEMKEKKLYVCEHCGTAYNSKAQCERCEKNHKKVKRLDRVEYAPITGDETGYPKSITVELDNGDKVKYKRY